tara:strand:+ start:873 stop:1367 length:495 start_codon:yes stop_codon:yes gene_type:complete
MPNFKGLGDRAGSELLQCPVQCAKRWRIWVTFPTTSETAAIADKAEEHPIAIPRIVGAVENFDEQDAAVGLAGCSILGASTLNVNELPLTVLVKVNRLLPARIKSWAVFALVNIVLSPQYRQHRAAVTHNICALSEHDNPQTNYLTTRHTVTLFIWLCRSTGLA